MDLGSNEKVSYIGHVAIFYIPVKKLELLIDGNSPKKIIAEYLLNNFDAYTMEVSDTKGFWREHKKSRLFIDRNARYEVSFEGRLKVNGFVDFLSNLCALIQEEAIYLTMGYKSYLIHPSKENQ
jgi:hypothetical protein